MRIQTEYLSFKNHWTISSSYDFQVHRQCSQRWCCFSHTALQWFELLLVWSPVLPGLSLVLPVLSPVHPGALRFTWRPMCRSSQLWYLTPLGFWSDSSQTLPEAPSDIITFWWCRSHEIGAWRPRKDMYRRNGVRAIITQAISWNKEKEFLDQEYQNNCNQLKAGYDNIDKNYQLKDDILCWKNSVYAPEGMRTWKLNSQRNSEVAGHIGRETTMELITRQFYWPNVENEGREYCNECGNCQRTKSPRHVKHGLVQSLEMAWKPSMHSWKERQ